MADGFQPGSRQGGCTFRALATFSEAGGTVLGVPPGGCTVRVSERRFGEAAILELHGSMLGPHASELLQISVRGQLLARAPILILNMVEVTEIDREGLEALSTVAGTVQQSAGELRIAGRVEELAGMGVLRQLAGTVATFATVEDALGDVRSALERRQSSVRARWSRWQWVSSLRRRLGV